jgi:hypothetical protein
VPNLKVGDAGAGHDFYVDFLGLEKEFDLGWIASFRSPENRSIQVSLVSGDGSAPVDSAISVNVDDVDAAYTEARRRGDEIVYRLTEERLRLVMWPTSFALKELTAAEEARIAALVKKAVS